MRINWKNPISHNLVAALVPTAGNINVVDSTVFLDNEMSISTTRSGRAWKTTATGQELHLSVPELANLDDGRVTFAALCIPHDDFANEGNPGRLVHTGDSQNDPSFMLGWTTSTQSFEGRLFSSGEGRVTLTGISAPVDQLHFAVLTYNLSDFILYLDGVQKESTSTPSATSLSNEDGLLYVANAVTEGRTFTGEVLLVYVWNRCLSPVEVGILSRNPWQLFQRSAIIVPLTPPTPVVEAPATTVIITDVDGDETWIDGDTGLVATGSGFLTFP